MTFKRLKLEFFYLRKAFFAYKNGWHYVYNRYFLAPKILNHAGVLERASNHNDLSVHVLTCHHDLVMLIWSLASFYQVMSIIGELYIHNDGTLNVRDKKILKKFFPSAKIIEPNEFFEKRNSELERCPLIKKIRDECPEYVLLKKLLDPYLVSDKKHLLIIDSDLMWFKRPEEIEQEIQNGCLNSLMMSGAAKDGQLNYVYYQDGTKLSADLAAFNSGIVLYRKENFNLEKLVNYLAKIDLAKPANKHFIEQAGYASCLENLKCLLEDKYVVKEMVDDKILVKHYTSPRRPLFYLEGLEKIKKFLIHNS